MTTASPKSVARDSRADVRGAVALVERELLVENDASAALRQAWRRLVEIPALTPPPELRECPRCGMTGMRAATRCGYCWKALEPLRSISSAFGELLGLARRPAQSRHLPRLSLPDTRGAGRPVAGGDSFVPKRLLSRLRCPLPGRLPPSWARESVVSGYHTSDAAEDGAGSTHAWAEVYLPGPGWKGFDPTAGVVTGSEHIEVAVARHPERVPPIAGSYIGPIEPRPTMVVSVRVCSV
jgi:hypothetical protein